MKKLHWNCSPVAISLFIQTQKGNNITIYSENSFNLKLTKDKSNFYSWLRSIFHFLNGKNYRFVHIFLIFDLFLFISCKHFVDNDYPTRVIVGIKCKYEFLTLIEKAQIRIRENWCFLNETYLWDFLRLKPFLANRFVWMIVQCELGCLRWFTVAQALIAFKSKHF